MAGEPDFKKGPRVVDQDARDAYVLEVGVCMGCGEPNRTWVTKNGRVRSSLNFDHIVNRSQGGDDCRENGFVLCGSGTTGCHGEKHLPVRDKAGYVRPIRMQLRAVIERDEGKRLYVVTLKSEDWLETYYPSESLRRRRGEPFHV